jgi:CheY-like chemotaxis protein
VRHRDCAEEKTDFAAEAAERGLYFASGQFEDKVIFKLNIGLPKKDYMKKHIFLVDDNQETMRAFMQLFSSTGIPFKCTWAKNGEQALRQLAYLAPDIIIMGIDLAGMNGLKCLSEIKRIDQLKEIPVLLYSSTITEDCRVRAFALGASACLKKPDCVTKGGHFLVQLMERATADAEC